MLTLFPAIRPYNTFCLPVDSLHTLYVEECGNPKGLPILFVHGGPGAGCNADHRRFFDPEKYHIILFDQRGSGRSTPHAELGSNTTQDLIEDIEKIREKLGIQYWILFGGSWGSTLSLLYAEEHSNRVLGLIVRGIFLCREKDLYWFYQGGAGLVYPDYWQDFIQPIPIAEREDMINAYYQRLTGDDDLVRMSVAKNWAQWEARCATLDPNAELVQQFISPHTAMSLARIETHYFVNRAFIDEGQILHNIDRLKNIPGIIVHGRYDMVCPLDNAYALHSAWPKSQLNILRSAGHSASEPAIVDALVHATNEMAYRYA